MAVPWSVWVSKTTEDMELERHVEHGQVGDRTLKQKPLETGCRQAEATGDHGDMPK